MGGEALKCWSDYLLLFEWLDDNSSQVQSQQINENNSQYFFIQCKARNGSKKVR